MQKLFFVFSCCLMANAVFAAGVDVELFGFKICNVGFDANPFSRDDGRTAHIAVSHCAPQYYTPPVRSVPAVSATAQKRTDERAITVKDSSNVTIINQESQQNSRPVYAPRVQTTYPTCYTYPVTYTYPTYYYQPYYYHYPRYYYHRYW